MPALGVNGTALLSLRGAAFAPRFGSNEIPSAYHGATGGFFKNHNVS